MQRRAVFLLGFLGFSALALSAGLAIFQKHYFIFVLPAVALLAGAAAADLTDLFPGGRTVLRLAPLLLFACALGLPTVGNRDIFYSLSPEAFFGKSISIIHLSNRSRSPNSSASTPTRRILSPSSVRNRKFTSIRTVTPQPVISIPMLLWKHSNMPERCKRKWSRRSKRRAPRLVVFVSVPPSSLVEEKSDRTILNWINNYLGSNYVGIGLVNIFSFCSRPSITCPSNPLPLAFRPIAF